MRTGDVLSTVSVGAILATLATAPAWAETSAPNESAGTQLEEVVVTAQRRAENLQKVPVVVQAVSQEQIQARGVTNLLELQRLSPALTVQDTASNVSPFIRGVGTTLTGAGQAASVATYVDGVYIATLTSAAFDLDNAEQVQVLSGPQGALYGRNATGGAIVVTTRTPKPGEAFSGGARVTLGNYNTRAISAHVVGGLGENLAGYLTASLRKHDGYVDNLDPAGFGSHNDDLNDRDAWNIQGALTYQPTDRLSFILRGSHFQSKDRLGFGLQAVGLDIPVAGGLNGSQTYYAGVLQSLGFSPAAAGAAASNLRFSTKTGETYDNEANGFTRGLLGGKALPGSFSSLEVDSVSLKAAYRFDAFEVSSLSSYTKAKSNAATEIILANPATYPAGLQGGSVGFSGNFPSENFQEDFQITSIGGPIQYVAGIFYFDSSGDVALTGDLPPLSAITSLNKWSSKSLAGYAQATVPIVDHLSATLGARYTDEKYKIVDGLNLSTPGNLFGLPNQGTPRKNSSQATYTARLQYDAGPFLAYAGVATGFKGATLSPVNLASPGVDPEKITSYEAGVKWDITPSVRVNASAFHYIYDNIHIAYTDTTTGAGILVNGTGAKLTGVDFQGLVRPTEWLTLRTGGLLLKSEYNADTTSAGTVAVLHTKGNRLAGAPKVVLSLGGDISFPQVTSGDLKLSFDVLYNAGYYFDAENLIGTGGATASPFTTVDLSLRYKPDGARWDVSVFGTNIGNEKSFQSGISASGILRSALAASPALYGVNFGVNF